LTHQLTRSVRPFYDRARNHHHAGRRILAL
jgi:hypothetical protein